MTERLPQPRTEAGLWVSPFTEELKTDLLERIAGGERLTHIEQEDGMPNRVQVWRWTKSDPEFGRAMAEARMISGHILEERALDIADELLTQTVPKEQIRALDVALTQYRWSAGKRNPQYNEKSPAIPALAIQIVTDLWAAEPGDLQPAEFKVIAHREPKEPEDDR